MNVNLFLSNKIDIFMSLAVMTAMLNKKNFHMCSKLNKSKAKKPF